MLRQTLNDAQPKKENETQNEIQKQTDKKEQVQLNPIADLKQQKLSERPRQSQMFRMSKVDPRKLKQLKKYLFIDQSKKKQGQLKQQNKCSLSQILSIRNYNVNSMYFLAMVVIQLCIISLNLCGIIQISSTKRIVMSVIAFVLGTFLIAWVCYMTWAKDFIDKYWAIFWISIGISFVGAAITGLTNVWYISLIFNMLTCTVNSIILIFMRKQWITAGVVILLFIFTLISGVIIQGALLGQLNHTFKATYPFLTVFGIFLLILIYTLYKKKWKIRTRHQKWETLCYIYLLTILLVFGLSASIQAQHIGIWLSQIVNINFLFNLGYYLMQIKFIKIPCLKKNDWYNNKLYAISDILLTNDTKYKVNPRKSVVGKPLSQCTNCLSEQSRFCYQNCFHACVGYDCVTQWLKRGLAKCPLCRQFSQFMLELNKTNDLEYEIINRYTFDKPPGKN